MVFFIGFRIGNRVGVGGLAPGVSSSSVSRTKSRITQEIIEPYSKSKSTLHKTVVFRGFPPSILENDDKLNQFSTLALQQFKPIHFAVHKDVLIAKFEVPVSIHDLRVKFNFFIY